MLVSSPGGTNRDTRILFNQIYNPASDGIRVALDSGTTSIFAPKIVGNTVVGAIGAGSASIRLLHNGASGAITDAVITDNTVRDGAFGILGQGRVQYTTCQANTARNNTGTDVDFSGSTLSGNIVFGNPTDGTENTIVQRLTTTGPLKAGTQSLLGNAAVSVTGATTILSKSASANPTTLYVAGESGGAGFIDVVVHAFAGAAPIALSSTTMGGAPSARTYTLVGSNITLAMAAGTYSVRVMSLESQ